ncbi:major facilitator superfamily MFS-1 [Coprinopsis marcescibilis]|uniref:Major facilitator superfamily MFS-1 n=1 Tax=Coprinopsis marcescibilis TaxID=230819 RepID=A0A5C3KHA8_COPMA|nr:major facilitator superfamily MFS-1 [Coprinopsis marcescibilis]
MSSSQRPAAPIRSFGLQDGTQESDEAQLNTPSAMRRMLGRLSFSSSKRRPSFLRRHDEEGEDIPMERPPIPSMMQTGGETYTTPLPMLSMIVLSITMLGEFLSANVSTPFLLFMVKDFGELSNEAEVAFWTGIIVSTFFLTQFLTSLLWATVAEKHGRRAVLVVSLSGGALTCVVFGTATTLKQAICIRLLQGVFAGSVGVARGSVAFITDPSNEGRAYAILGFCWGFGGVAGAIIGGSFERPASKWPDTFSGIPLFVKYPYLLPCAIAAVIMLSGSFLACFLDRDGGPRQGAIQLPFEKDNNLPPPIPEEDASALESPFEEEEPSPGILGLRKKISRRFSNIFAKRVPDIDPSTYNANASQPAVPMHAPPNLERTRTFSRTSRANGSAYGYSGAYRKRLASAPTWNTRRGSLGSTMRRRRGSNYDAVARDSSNEGEELNFAQRLLMANENAVTNIADLWVAAAMNVDNEDPFESDSDEEGQDEDAVDLDEELEGDDGTSTAGPSSRRMSQSASAVPSSSRHRPSVTSTHSASAVPRRLSQRHPPVSFTPLMHRRPSMVPSIFSHSGVRTPPAMLEAQRLLSGEGEDAEALATIAESRQASQVDVESLHDKSPSIASQLPILIIIQYGVLALHTTTHDQVFMSYLVSDFDSGGLNLNAGHFAQLIALMCLAQIAYQFYLYPNMGPPRGRFSHLAMFRIGSIIFIPSYLTVTLYRPLASAEDGGNALLMMALIFSTALRYCGIVFGYTSISILLNYMTPPAAVGYANGVAQSIVSLARCIGPVIGGYLWSASIEDNPSGYYFGFLVCSGVCALTVIQSFLIR